MSLHEYVDATVRAQLDAHPGLGMQGHIAVLARAGHDGFMFREAVGRLFAPKAPTMEAILQYVRDKPGHTPSEIKAAVAAMGRNPKSVPGSLTILRRRLLVRAYGPVTDRRYYPVNSTRLPHTEKVFAVLADGQPRRFRAIFELLAGQDITHQQVRNALVQLYQGGRIGVRGMRHAFEYHLPVASAGGPGVLGRIAVDAIRATRLWPADPTPNGPQLRIAA